MIQIPFAPAPDFPDAPPAGPVEQFLAVVILIGLILLTLPEKWRDEIIRGLFGSGSLPRS